MSVVTLDIVAQCAENLSPLRERDSVSAMAQYDLDGAIVDEFFARLRDAGIESKIDEEIKIQGQGGGPFGHPNVVLDGGGPYRRHKKILTASAAVGVLLPVLNAARPIVLKWLETRQNSGITIKTKDGTIDIRGPVDYDKAIVVMEEEHRLNQPQSPGAPESLDQHDGRAR
jgi:hypothetical protein